MAEAWVTHGFSVEMLRREGHVAVITPCPAAEVRGVITPGTKFRVRDRDVARLLTRHLGVRVLVSHCAAYPQPGDVVFAARQHGRGALQFTRVRLLSRDELVSMVSPSLGEGPEWQRVAEEVTRLSACWRG